MHQGPRPYDHNACSQQLIREDGWPNVDLTLARRLGRWPTIHQHWINVSSLLCYISTLELAVIYFWERGSRFELDVVTCAEISRLPARYSSAVIKNAVHSVSENIIKTILRTHINRLICWFSIQFLSFIIASLVYYLTTERLRCICS